jgi:hypothetical protein
MALFEPHDWLTTKLVTFIANLTPRALARKLRAECIGFVSSGMTVVPEGKLGFSQGVLVRDPDGHAVLLIQKEG